MLGLMLERHLLDRYCQHKAAAVDQLNEIPAEICRLFREILSGPLVLFDSMINLQSRFLQLHLVLDSSSLR